MKYIVSVNNVVKFKNFLPPVMSKIGDISHIALQYKNQILHVGFLVPQNDRK